MQPGIGKGAEPTDITSVLGNIRLKENDMKHDKTWKLEQLDCKALYGSSTANWQ